MADFPPIRRRAHTPSHGAGASGIARLAANAAANPLLPGSPNYYREAQAQQLAAAQQTASYAAGASRAFERKNMKSGFWHAGKALGALGEGDQFRGALRAGGIPVTPYQAPEAPAPHNPVFPPYSGPINLKPGTSVASAAAAAKPSIGTQICNGISCGLYSKYFGKVKSEGGRRKTYKKNKKSKKRQSRKM